MVTFSIRTASADDSQLISAVISHRRYRDHCAGPFGEQAYHDLHGPYRIETITVPAFQRRSIAQAVEKLYAWPGYELTPHYAHKWQQSQEIIGAWVTPVLQSATTIYRLVLPREGHEHDWGWVVACGGFHEFIAVDRDHSTVTLVIATDD